MPVRYNGGGGSGGVPTGGSAGALITDTLSPMRVRFPDTNTSPTDTSLFTISTSFSDANATPTETLKFQAAYNDANATPAEGRRTTSTVGATSVAQTVGTGWTTVSNAASLRNTTYANLNSAAGLTPPTVTGTIEGTYVTLGALTFESQDTVTATMTVWGPFVVGLLGTGSFQIRYSVNAGSSWTNVATYTASFGGPTTANVTLSAVNFDQFKFQIIGSVKGGTTQASIIQVDAVELAINHTGL